MKNGFQKGIFFRDSMYAFFGLCLGNALLPEFPIFSALAFKVSIANNELKYIDYFNGLGH